MGAEGEDRVYLLRSQYKIDCDDRSPLRASRLIMEGSAHLGELNSYVLLDPSFV